MIAKLDHLVEGGKGDDQFKELFKSIMLMQCENHSTMRDQVILILKTFMHLLCSLFKILYYKYFYLSKNSNVHNTTLLLAKLL